MVVGGKELLRRGLLHQLTEVHDADALGDVPHDGKVVGDKHQRQPQILLQLLKKVKYLGLDGDVEGGYRLVADDEGGAE